MPVKPPLALVMVWRDARAAAGKFSFVILAVAAGVGALTGVRGFSRAFQSALLREARTLMAADIAVRTFTPPTPEQQEELDWISRRGASITGVIETLSMMSPAGASRPIMVSIKAVDPRLYPFYGNVQLDPPADLRDALSASTVAVSDDLLLRLGVQVGRSVKLGAAQFRIAGVLRVEPDRMTGSLNVGPRVMLTREGLDRTGLMKFGSRASYRVLVRLPAGGLSVDEARWRLKRAFGQESRITDFRETHPVITRGLKRSTTFLSLVSLIALIIGGLGVAAALHSHLQQKMDAIGILKCLGARSSQVIRIYLLEALLLGLAGSVAGIVLGYLVQAAFPRLIPRFFVVPVGIRWGSAAVIEGLGLGLLTTLLFTLPPLLSIRKIKPSDIFRRDMPEPRPPWRARLREARESLAAGAVILAALGGIAAWLSDSARLGLIFLGGLAVSLAVLAAAAWLLHKALRALPGILPWRLPPSLRHGMANLYRPGSHSGAALVALGIGVTFTLTVYLVQHSLLLEVMSSAPPDMPNVFLINITDRERDGIAGILRSHPGVEDAKPLVPMIAARLAFVDGTPVGRLPLQGWGRRFLGPRYVTWAEHLPRHTEVLQGAFWKGRPASPEVSVDDDAAHVLHLRPGMQLEWQMPGRTVSARVASVHRTEVTRFGSNVEFIFSPGSLDGLPAVYYASARVRARDVPALQKTAFERYPTVTVINAADVLDTVQQVIDQIALVVRFISAFAVLGGVIILAAGVAGTRFRRIREVSILKTLGATRGRVAAIFSVEFFILGAVAGLVGSALATGLSSLLLHQLLEARLDVNGRAAAGAVLATALAANAGGWAASFRILGLKPLEILRQE
jgi:putative ABC transport system permease protein